MGILLVRHAEAVPEDAADDDAARWLSLAGRAQAREVGARVREHGLQLRRVLTSPRVRAVQTAELFTQALGFQGLIESLPALSYTVPAQQAARRLAAFAATEHVAAFGHMPTIAQIAAQLTNNGSQRGFSLCEALWIEQGQVVWTVAPH
jgi:phosphohistidine phosphatase